MADNAQQRTSPLLSVVSGFGVPGRAVPISLSSPRPDLEREQNEYIQSPLRGPSPEDGNGDPRRHRRRRTAGSGNDDDDEDEGTFALVTIGERPTLEKNNKKVQSRHRRGSWTSKKLDAKVVTDRPTAASAPSLGSLDWKGESQCEEQHLSAVELGGLSVSTSSTLNATGVSAAGVGGDPSRRGVDGSDSIICRRCGRCKCDACKAPRQFPSKWLCGNKCLCSPKTAVEYASCVWCVQCLFYHCVDDADSSDRRTGSFSDDPCGCYPEKFWTRWSCLAALAVPLPCLLCYWPLRGAVSTAQAAYQSLYRMRHSCRCAERDARAASLSTTTTGPTSTVISRPPTLTRPITPATTRNLRLELSSMSSTSGVGAVLPPPATLPPPLVPTDVSSPRHQLSCSSSTSSRTLLLLESRRFSKEKDFGSSCSE